MRLADRSRSPNKLATYLQLENMTDSGRGQEAGGEEAWAKQSRRLWDRQKGAGRLLVIEVNNICFLSS